VRVGDVCGKSGCWEESAAASSSAFLFSLAVLLSSPVLRLFLRQSCIRENSVDDLCWCNGGCDGRCCWCWGSGEWGEALWRRSCPVDGRDDDARDDAGEVSSDDGDVDDTAEGLRWCDDIELLRERRCRSLPLRRLLSPVLPREWGWTVCVDEDDRHRGVGVMNVIVLRCPTVPCEKLTVGERGGGSLAEPAHVEVLPAVLGAPEAPCAVVAAADVPARMYVVLSSGAEKRVVSSEFMRKVAASPTSIVARATWMPFHSGDGMRRPPSATVDPERRW
jgi:hypothetical protein